ncbi:MAG TPA: class II aldolase/adducin family protein [Chthoniobacterales bacterium]
MSETGVVKFTCEHVGSVLPECAGLHELNACRRKLLQLRLIGVDAGGIGYGNLSVRDPGTPAFYITGSGTSGLAQLGLEHVAKVSAYDFARNWLRCEGGTVASSESLTHAAIYAADSNAAAVIHCHSPALWKRLLASAPSTPADVEYGTPELAHAITELFRTTDAKERKILAMGGHVDGVLAFGATLDDALRALLLAIATH